MAKHSEAEVLKVDQRSLYSYVMTMLFLAVLGFVVYGITRVSATQLDGIISLINAGVGEFLRVVSLADDSRRGSNLAAFRAGAPPTRSSTLPCARRSPRSKTSTAMNSTTS